MKIILSLLSLSFAVIFGSPQAAFAQTNSAPICVAKTIPANAPESSYISSITISPFILDACSDADGDPMTVVSVTEEGQLEDGQIVIPYPSESGQVVVGYTVSDSNGAEATSTISLRRQ